MTTKSKPLSRDDILNAPDRATEVVEVPEWGGAVTVRALSGSERGRYESAALRYRRTPSGGLEIESVDTDNQRPLLVSLSVIDADGKRLFQDKDLHVLAEKDAAALDRVFQVAQRLSHLRAEDIEALKTGLKAGPNGSSGSASPETSA